MTEAMTKHTATNQVANVEGAGNLRLRLNVAAALRGRSVYPPTTNQGPVKGRADPGDSVLDGLGSVYHLAEMDKTDIGRAMLLAVCAGVAGRQQDA